MAHKLMLTVPFQGMPFLWNVSNTVGTENSETNAGTDVRLVKLLVAGGIDVGGGVHAAPSARVKPVINDIMDQSLGFWIYYGQVEGKFPADGVVSVAPKFPSNQYFIVRLNLVLYQNNRAYWEGLPANPLTGSALAAELLAPPK